MTANVEEEAIKALIERRAQAVRDKDVDALMADVDPAALSFDVVGPLRFAGADDVRARAREWFASFESTIELETRELKIEANGKVAFYHCLNRIRGALAGGNKVDMWVRSTVCLRKENEKWMITHQHTSVPFDATTGEAALDLKP
jgi:ketosteroid isomerase-like protein